MVRRHEEVPRDQDPHAEIMALALAYRRGALEQRELYGLMFERAVPSFRPDEQDIRYAMRSLDRVQDAVTRAIGPHRRSRDPHTVTVRLWAVVHGLASLELRGALLTLSRPPPAGTTRSPAVTAGLFPGILRRAP
jgi:hypothetical protein